MNRDPQIEPNVTSVAALLMVTSMEQSLHFYVEGLGFTIQNRWIVEGKLRWCWMTLGNAALMLQEMTDATRQRLTANGTLGTGSALYFQCHDALAIYRQAKDRGVACREPQVGNHNWEVFLVDPDGYHINFCSPTDLPEESLLSQVKDTQH